MAKTVDTMTIGSVGKNIVGMGCRGGSRRTGQPPTPRSALRRPMGRPRFFSILRGSHRRMNGCVLRNQSNAGSASAGWI